MVLLLTNDDVRGLLEMLPSLIDAMRRAFAELARVMPRWSDGSVC